MKRLLLAVAALPLLAVGAFLLLAALVFIPFDAVEEGGRQGSQLIAGGLGLLSLTGAAALIWKAAKG